jgi:gamma-glutamylaminecyclotransferase
MVPGGDASNFTSYPVFVYGTLKGGFPNASHMHSEGVLGGEVVGDVAASYLGVATTVDRLPLVVGPFQIPFLLDLPGRSGASQVCGELYAVTPGALAYLDAFEGVPQQFYARVLLRVRCDKVEDTSGPDSSLRAWAYVRHPGNGGGQRWAREWPVERLARLRMMDAYTEEHAKGYNGRELAESADGCVSHAGDELDGE